MIKLPCALLDESEQLIRKFYWGEDENQRKIHPTCWEVICRSKECGGLGIKNLSLMNKALLAKLTWRLIHNPNQLWAIVLISKYGSSMVQKRWSSSISQVWRAVLFGGETLKQMATMGTNLSENTTKERVSST